jgi:hypothetical protein
MWWAVEDAAAAFEPAGMHAVRTKSIDTLRARHPDHQAAPGVAAVLTQLHDSKPNPFVLASWRFNMAKNTGDKQTKDEETISD